MHARSVDGLAQQTCGEANAMVVDLVRDAVCPRCGSRPSAPGADREGATTLAAMSCQVGGVTQPASEGCDSKYMSSKALAWAGMGGKVVHMSLRESHSTRSMSAGSVTSVPSGAHTCWIGGRRPNMARPIAYCLGRAGREVSGLRFQGRRRELDSEALCARRLVDKWAIV